MTKPQGVALIGLGMVAPVFADAVGRLSPDIALRGVMASSAESGNRFLAEQHALLPRDCRRYNSVEEIVTDDRIDFAVLATPPDARTELIDVLAEAGTPILMEKPIERTLVSATAIVERCESAGVPLGIVLQHRAKHSIRRLLDRLETGELGALGMVEVRVPWWRPQHYYDAAGRGTRARDGGGVLLTQAIHTIDLALALAGPVAAVTAFTATTVLHDMETEDFATVGIEFANGAVGSILATTAAFPGAREEIRLHAERASATLHGDQLAIKWHDGRVEEVGVEEVSVETVGGEPVGGSADGEQDIGGGGENPIAFPSDLHMAMIDDFAAALRDSRPPLVTGRDALEVHELIDAIERSAATGQRVELR